RRRHTRFSRDWSSDVCSSDLTQGEGSLTELPTGGYRIPFVRRFDRSVSDVWSAISSPDGLDAWFPTTLRHEGVVGTAITETFEEIGRASCRERGRASGGCCTQ